MNNNNSTMKRNRRGLKTLFALITLLCLANSLSAQNFTRRGFAFGADRDTLLYIIASPFDNWFLTFNGGVQTFMGNEIESSARHNKLNYLLGFEIGKWIIPDLAVSAKFSYFTVDGQSRYSLQPFIDFTGVPTHVENGVTYYDYQPFHAQALSLIGYVTFDWTNFFVGYEVGRRRRFHVFTPIGLGASMLYGETTNPRNDKYGSIARNFELSYAASIGMEYEISKEFSLNAVAELFGSESTWDWSPYDNSRTIFDIMPRFTIGARINLLKQVHKRDMYTNQVFLDTVYHYFRSFGTRNTIPSLRGRIKTQELIIDSIQNLADQLDADNSSRELGLQEAIRLRDSLQNELDSLSKIPTNVMQELILANDEWKLPATIVYYQLDKYDLDINARKRLQKFAKSMSKMNDTLEFFIVGAADSLTGSKRHNDWLSQRRCEAAFNALVKDYGANANQFTLVPVGGITAYEPAEDNRMALIILRTPEVEAIIRKWNRFNQ